MSQAVFIRKWVWSGGTLGAHSIIMGMVQLHLWGTSPPQVDLPVLAPGAPVLHWVSVTTWQNFVFV